jgi:hypothetical protein
MDTATLCLNVLGLSIGIRCKLLINKCGKIPKVLRGRRSWRRIAPAQRHSTMTMPQPAPLRRQTAPQFLRYAGAGAAGTALHYAILVALVQFAGIGAVLASTRRR